jgi:hypothetical protein
MVREVFQPPGPPRKPNLLVQGVHAFVLDVRMLLEVCGAKGAATCHTTTGKVKIKTVIPAQGSLHASVTPQGPGYNTGEPLHVTMEVLLSVTWDLWSHYT